MIVDPVPSLRRIASEVWKPLTILFIWDCAVTVTYYLLPFHAPELPLTIFGSALALFLGFRSNSSYQRWWEGRVLWGAMINASRNIARAARNFLPDPQARDLKREIVKRQIAYVNALRCQLRRQPIGEDVTKFLEEQDTGKALARVNAANGLLDSTGRRIDMARREGMIDTIQQTQMEAVLVDIANAQGGMERIKNTPLPSGFEFMPNFFTRLFCVLLPISLVETLDLYTPIGSTLIGMIFLAALRIGQDLTDPFANTVHDVPLSTMCRTIEIDLLESLGRKSPGPLPPVAGTQW